MKYFQNKFIVFAYLTSIIIGINACEDVIDVDLDQGESQVAVDAFLFNIPNTTQRVRLTRTNPYFDNKPSEVITNAFVTLSRPDGTTDTLVQDPATPGNYLLKRIDFQINVPYNLRIAVDEQIYTATSQMRRVCLIDSLTDTLRGAEFGNVATPVVALYARDLPGLGDRYWFRVFKNGVAFNKADQIVISADGALGPNAPADGLAFIRPIRESLNVSTSDDNNVPINKTGDKIKLELCSIDQITFNFFNEAIGQINNGGLFATPPANVPSNIKNSNPNGKKAVGWFCVVNASVDSVTIR